MLGCRINSPTAKILTWFKISAVIVGQYKLGCPKFQPTNVVISSPSQHIIVRLALLRQSGEKWKYLQIKIWWYIRQKFPRNQKNMSTACDSSLSFDVIMMIVTHFSICGEKIWSLPAVTSAPVTLINTSQW